LLEHARFTHFVPVLTYRYTRDQLRCEAIGVE
jgi:hypothetical protein